jgi:hypothetical protein
LVSFARHNQAPIPAIANAPNQIQRWDRPGRRGAGSTGVSFFSGLEGTPAGAGMLLCCIFNLLALRISSSPGTNPV